VGELSDYLKEHVPYMARRLKGVEQQPVIIPTLTANVDFSEKTLIISTKVF